MASTDKTPKLGLNQWAAGDDVLRADFNADNGKIDAGVQEAMAAAAAAALAASNAVIKIASGQLHGDGKATHDIELGFRPKLVFFAYANQYYGFDIFNEHIICHFTTNHAPYAYPMKDAFYIITDTGFRSMCVEYNVTGHDLSYIALG